MTKLPSRSESLWISSSPSTHYPAFSQTSADESASYDVAVVGGGIAGITTAFLLKRAGLRVALLEKGRIVRGETGHTTAHVTEYPDQGLHDLMTDFGVDAAGQVLQAGRAALELIRSNVEQMEIDCELENLPAYLYCESHSQLADLEREHWAAQKLGMKVERLNRAPLPFPTFGGMSISDQAQFHPRKYLLALAATIPGQGSRIFEETPVSDVTEGDPCVVQTSGGSLTAKNLVITTDAPVAGSTLIQTRAAAYRTYVVAVRLGGVRKSLPPGLFWDLSDPYHYIRRSGPYVLVGGEDHKVGMEKDTNECFERLLRYTSARFDVEEVAYRWSGQILEPMDGLPLIGKNPFSRHLYLASGFSGNGMAWGTLAGMILADLIQGRTNPWIPLFSPGRISPLASLPGYLTENKDYPVCMVLDRIAAPEARSVSEISKGEGKIVFSGERRIAVYRKEDGGLEGVDPVCTHMGCLVRFNRAEKSWDCPCHGSRFGTDGRVLHGPATKPLGKIPMEAADDAPESGEKIA